MAGQRGLIISAAPPDNESDEGLLPEGESESRPFDVHDGEDGRRLDHVLVRVAPEFSRSYLQQLVADGAVAVNGRVLRKPAARLHAGDSGRVELRPTPQTTAFLPQPMALRVVHADAHLLIIDKPAGLVVHPAPGHWSGTLLNGLLAWDPALAEVPRAGIVHRLDKDTSGLMLVARSRPAMDALVAMIAARTVVRQYLALAHRPWSGPAAREVDAAIGRDPAHRLRMAVLDPRKHAAKPARTSIECLDVCPQGALVRCSLHTGRTHQIRVHMQSIGHPLVGDATYGGSPAAGMQRQALHAFRLALAHPVDGRPLDVRSALPDDFAQALRAWGLRYNEV